MHGFLPSDLTDTVLVPIVKDKTGDISDKGNYRPIALASVISKIFEMALLVIRFRDNLYKKIKLTNPASIEYETLRINLKTYNKILRTSICAAKQQFLAFTFEKYKSDIKNTWKTINEILSKK